MGKSSQLNIPSLEKFVLSLILPDGSVGGDEYGDPDSR
jgi:hypothetical protein